jgi:arsenite-transporting ATPase
MLGGKGGVGKTTMAAAISVAIASSDKKTLIISTDPAHSLSDSFGQAISGEITSIEGIDNLHALEIDPDKALDEYRGLALAGTPEDEILSQFLGEDSLSELAPPGTDETVAFMKLLEFMELRSGYDVIVVDTAPTGHTLRLLSLPEVMDNWIFKIIKLRRKMSSLTGVIKTLFRGTDDNTEKRAEEMLEKLKERIEDALDYLSDPSATIFIPVTIPTMMSVLETQRLVKALDNNEMPHSCVIINQLIPENPDCNFCTKVRKNQAEIVTLIRDSFPTQGIIEILMQSEEVKGVKKLKKLAASHFQ